jgi:hypothetical protein
MEVRVQHEGGAVADRGVGIVGALSRISWGAVFAGLVIATALQVVLTVLGAAIGLTALDGPDSGRAFGIGNRDLGAAGAAGDAVRGWDDGGPAGQRARPRRRLPARRAGVGHVAAAGDLPARHGCQPHPRRDAQPRRNITGSAVSTASTVAAGQDLDAGTLQSARARVESEARQRGLSEADVQAQVARVQESAGEVADKAQSVAAGGAWLALLALGLSLGAAAFGALRATRDAAPVRTTAVA